MVHESDSDANCNWYAWYSHQRIGKGTGRLGNKRASGNHPNYSIVEKCPDTKKNPGYLRKLAVAHTPGENDKQTLV